MLEKRDLQFVRLAVRRKWLTAEEGEDCLFLKRKLGEKYTIEEVIRKRGYLDDAALEELASATAHLIRRRPVAAGRPPPVAPSVAAATTAAGSATGAARVAPKPVTRPAPAPPPAAARAPADPRVDPRAGRAPSPREATVLSDEVPGARDDGQQTFERTLLEMPSLDLGGSDPALAEPATMLGMAAITPDMLSGETIGSIDEKTVVGVRLEDLMKARHRADTQVPSVVVRTPMDAPRPPSAQAPLPRAPSIQAPSTARGSSAWARARSVDEGGPRAPSIQVRPSSLRGWSSPHEEPTGDDLTPGVSSPAVPTGSGLLVRPVPLDELDGRAEVVDDEALSGTLGPYAIKRLIGRGSMGVVYLAEPVGGGDAVALKLLRRDLLDSAEHLERFRREAQAASAIDSPHVVPVMGVGTVEGRPYIALRYIDGFTLRERLDADEPPEVAEALRIARDVALALVAAETAGIVHRDVKPENVIVTGAGAVYLTDFGLAREASAGVEGLTSISDTVVGTPNYMAPEQAIGAPVDHRTDLYALGATLFHVLAGQPPFPGRSSVSIIAKHVRAPVPDLAAVDARITGPVASIVARLMAKNPADRFASALDLVEALEGVLASLAPAPKAVERVVGKVAIRTFAAASFLVALAMGLAVLARTRGLAVWGRPGIAVEAALGGAALVVVALLMLGAIGLVRRGELPLPGSTSWLVSLKDLTGVIGAGAVLASAALGPPAALDVLVLALGTTVLASWVFGYLLRTAIARQRKDRGGHVLALFGDLRLRRWRRVHVPLLASLAGLASARFAVLAYFHS